MTQYVIKIPHTTALVVAIAEVSKGRRSSV
jgi:hypothetical protein